MPNVVFVAPFFLPATLRFVRAVTKLPETRVVLVSQDSGQPLPDDIAGGVAAHLRVEDALSAGPIGDAVGEVIEKAGTVHRVIGALEELQVPLAEVRERFSIPGLGVDAAHAFRDKARMKSILREAGLPCAAHRLARSVDVARAFVRDVGFPVVVKPPAGAGARNTFRVDEESALEEYFEAFPPSDEDPALLEEFVVGEEHSFDSVVVDGRPVWHSISQYHPSPLEVLRQQWVQWCVVLPREIDGPEYAPIREAGFAAVRALGLETGLSHMEWFRRPDGSAAISEVGARPPGSHFTTLFSYAHDRDFYLAWARLMVFGTFEPPARDHAVGIVFLRGQGRGRVRAIHGLDDAQRAVGSVVVESRLPLAGQAPGPGYEGEGYVIVRHRETEVVEKALQAILRTVHVELG